MEQLFYEQWAAGASQHNNRKKSRSSSPISDAHCSRKRPHEIASVTRKKVETNNVDFEKARREIDLEMKRQEELERRHQEEIERKKAEEKKQKNNPISGITENDLRFMLEKCRGDSLKSITPPPLPPPMAAKSSFTIVNPSEIVQKIPGFDYSRLGSEPSSGEKRLLEIFNHQESKVNDNTEIQREKLSENFAKDCDTVALVTQMLIDENPILEQPLMEALKGVLQKVMQKHLEVLPR